IRAVFSWSSTMKLRILTWAIAAVLALAPGPASSSGPAIPLSGPETPRVEPRLGDDGLYHQTWFTDSFLDLKEDLNEAKDKGKRFAVIFEQRGCIYCTKMHKDVLSVKYVNDYVRENFSIISLNLFGAREVTDFDGKKMTEKQLAERWGIAFTPTIVFFKDDLKGLEGKWGRELEAVERLPLAFGVATFADLFSFVRTKTYETSPNFQRYHIDRMNERQALKK
ncbi:MAG TPA: thioredoxin family protein, partial [Hyphomicrobiaceae bacterium]|nr:thioredoxin family protein [Hyphomicrobiaceae bacterium]